MSKNKDGIQILQLKVEQPRFSSDGDVKFDMNVLAPSFLQNNTEWDKKLNELAELSIDILTDKMIDEIVKSKEG